ncbi:hypothetical protein PsorP6_005757 [Peronosclerospora sorghi]|uniref:Uncharacterized protein n=1 Tax=Peronosclerospora sorghi TaxID=230839 RepID=A0ACC0W7R9_9STRA|nr:hypothetical protein PsorP6_005757 [Peronosclerospora sorghi]
MHDIPVEQPKRQALLAKIAQLETCGAILPTDARTLRSQLHDSSSGEWKAVEVRLQQLVLNWNPYQDGVHSIAVEKQEKEKLNFYQLLSLNNDATVTTEDVKKQFRKLALLLHPDKIQASRKRVRKSKGVEQDDEEDEEKQRKVDSMQFARLKLAYETLSDPARRAAYDAKLLEISQPQYSRQLGEMVKGQVKLEASVEFASLEWMARVKHKMDVMARIAEWAKLLSLNPTELHFEFGEPCNGKGCGKIVSMDRELECSGSPRRRVYICLLHKYIHACDEGCTSTFSDAELDRRVCPMRAYWLIQNWIFDQLQIIALPRKQAQQRQDQLAVESESGSPVHKKLKQKASYDPLAAHEKETVSPVCGLEPSEIHLGDQYSRFQVKKAAECRSTGCRRNFQFLEDGIYACRRHGTPHICTFEQCDRQELHMGSYICWVSGKVYGYERERVGTDVRTRRVVYADGHGDENSVEMEVPVMLPLGKTTDFLLEGDSSCQRSMECSSLSPPPPDEKAWSKRPHSDLNGCDDHTWSHDRQDQKRLKRERKRARKKSVRQRLHERLSSKIRRAEVSFFPIFLKLPPAVANLPKVALELEEARHGSLDDEDTTMNATSAKCDKENLLQIFVNSHHSVNYIKYWMEELTDQQLSLWDQQIYWGDTLIGEETNVMSLEQHGISEDCVLELCLHDDCPLLVSTWDGKNAASGGVICAPVEYNTVQISKEAEEELDDLHQEWENVVVAEEQAFELARHKQKREKLELCGAIEHTEVLRYDDAKSAPRLVAIVQKQAIDNQRQQLTPRTIKNEGEFQKEAALIPIKSELLVKVERDEVLTGDVAMRSLSSDGQSVKVVKNVRPKREKKEA